MVAMIFFLALGLGASVVWFMPKTVGPALGIFLLFTIYWGYFAIFEILWKGQTPGKRVAGIRVIKESGRPINAFEAVGRNFMRAVDVLPGVYGVGVACMMFNRQSRRIGDFVAGTVVVHEKSSEEVRPVWNEAAEVPAAPTEMANVTADDLVLVETYLSRRLDLDPEVRLRTAIQIADRIKAKTGMQAQPLQHVDEFLEQAARKIRDTARFR